MNKCFAISALALASANVASANVVLTAVAGNGAASGSNFTYSYTAQLDGSQKFASGFTDAYCISDITGFVAGSASITATPGFGLTSGLTGGCNAAPTPLNSGLTAAEGAGAWIEVVYTPGATISGQTAIGVLPTITFLSTNGPAGGQYLGFGGEAVLMSNNTQAGNVGQLVGPGAPEPATLSLFGSALLGIGFIARKRIKKA